MAQGVRIPTPFPFPKEAGTLSPGHVAAIVHRDLSGMLPGERLYTRYFYVPHMGEVERLTFARVLSGACNGMSSEPEIKAPQPVDDSAAVFRVNIKWYGWTPEVWERLEDPFSNLLQKIETPGRAAIPDRKERWPGGRHPADGVNYSPGYFTYHGTPATPATVKTVFASGPWMALPPSSPGMLAEIQTWTGSRTPMVRGDWFHTQTATQEGKNPGYYDFLGVKDQKGFEKLVRFNKELGDRTEYLRVAVFSGISLQPRRLSRTNSVLGGYWESFDNEKAVGLNNPLTFLDERFEFSITEKFSPLLNGWPAWYLGDNKGSRADKALDSIVGGDRFGGSHDTRLAINLSCIRCHFAAMHEDGVKDLSAIGIKKLSDPDYDVLAKLTRQYLRDVAGPMEQDRLGYKRAVKTATGWEPVEYAKEYQRFYGQYEDAKISLKLAARQMGVPAEELGVKLAGYDLATGKLNPMLGILKDGGEIPIRQWEEAWPDAMNVYHSVELKVKGAKK